MSPEDPVEPGRASRRSSGSIGPARVWCQWWNAGVDISHSSGPNRQRRLAWMKNPQTVPIRATMMGTMLPAHPAARPGRAHRSAPGRRTGSNTISTRMGAGVDQEVDLLGTVMDGMEAPEERDLVAPAMAPVIADLPRHQPGERASPERQGRGRRMKAARNGAVHGPGQHAERRAEQQGGEQAAEEIVAEIGADPLAQDFLRMGGEETLQGHEDHDQDRQPQGEPEDIDQECMKMLTDELRHASCPGKSTRSRSASGSLPRRAASVGRPSYSCFTSTN